MNSLPWQTALIGRYVEVETILERKRLNQNLRLTTQCQVQDSKFWKTSPGHYGKEGVEGRKR
jgi:hypothetical protein